jgi:hypothetical protein
MDHAFLNPARRLPDNFQVPDDGIDGLVVLAKQCLIHAGGVAFDLPDRGEDVLNQQVGIALRHR